MRARRAALAAALACNPPVTGEPGPAPPAEPAPPQPACEEPPAGALALLPAERADPGLVDRTCPWVLVGAGAELTAHPLGRGDATDLRTALPVIPPPDCRPCRFSGVVTAIGPVILATRPSAGSELADAAWLGAGPAGPPLRPGAGPAPVVFAPLWFGRPGFGDSTLQGPPWALAPHLCGAREASPKGAGTTPGAREPVAPPPVPDSPALVLLAEPRLPGARAEEPPPALVRAAGVYAAAGGELLRQDAPVPSDMSACTRVPLELP